MSKSLKIVLAALCGAALGVVAARAQTQSATVTNRLGDVITVTLTDSGPASGVVRTILPPVGAQVSTNTTVVATQFTPRELGDLLIGTVSGKVYMATGRTTNDWKALN